MNDKTKIDGGGSVYPTIDGETWTHDEGITRRDWLAGMAMQGLLAKGIEHYTHCDPEEVESELPMWAYGVADSMIAEGRKGE